jgi:uncharacterized protein YkwD
MNRRSPLLLVVAVLLALASTAAPSAAAASRVGNHRASRAGGNPAAASEVSGGAMIAPVDACPQQESLEAGPEAQKDAMRCMANFARERAGLPPLADSPQLDVSATAKNADLFACDSFSHEACGRPFSYWIRQGGYTSAPCWHVGENLAWGTGEYGTVREIFRAWMRSPEHRHNILGEYAQLGLAVMTGELEGHAAAHVWTAHFGSRCEGSQ